MRGFSCRSETGTKKQSQAGIMVFLDSLRTLVRHTATNLKLKSKYIK